MFDQVRLSTNVTFDRACQFFIVSNLTCGIGFPSKVYVFSIRTPLKKDNFIVCVVSPWSSTLNIHVGLYIVPELYRLQSGVMFETNGLQAWNKRSYGFVKVNKWWYFILLITQILWGVPYTRFPASKQRQAIRDSNWDLKFSRYICVNYVMFDPNYFFVCPGNIQHFF